MTAKIKYKAFISYAHDDEKWAKWLHRSLEKYRISSDLVGRETAIGPVPSSLRPIFRDRDEITGGQVHDEAILAALKETAALIVICSPSAANSTAVHDEVLEFRTRFANRPVIPVIVDGSYPEFFPTSLRFEVTPDGEVTDRVKNIIGADFRAGKDGRRLGLSKIVAGIIGVGTDEIVRRDDARNRRTMRMAISSLLLLTFVFASISIWAERNRREAVEARKQTEVGESLYLAQRARQEARIDGLKAVQIALLGLPLDRELSSRELVAESMAALSDVYSNVWLPVEAPDPDCCITYFASFIENTPYMISDTDFNSIEVWNLDTGSTIGPPIEVETSLFSAQLSNDRSRVLTVSDEGKVELWNVSTGKSIPFLNPLRSVAKFASFSSDGRHFLIGSHNTVNIFDSATGTRFGSPIEIEQSISSATFSLDGSRLLIISESSTDEIASTAQIWDLETGKPIGSKMRHKNEIDTALFFRDGSLVLTRSFGGSVKIWDASSGLELAAPLFATSEFDSVSITQDGLHALTVSSSNVLNVWDIRTGTLVGAPMVEEQAVETAQFAPNGGRLVTITADHISRIRNIRTGNLSGSPMQHRGLIEFAGLSEDGSRLLLDPVFGKAQIWEQQKGALNFVISNHTDEISTAAYSPDGSLILTASADGSARLWDARTGSPIGKSMQHKSGVLFAIFSPIGNQILTTSTDGSSRMWDARTGSAVGPPMLHEGLVYFADFSVDGSHLVTVTFDGNVRVWDTITSEAVGPTITRDRGIFSARFSPDGQHLVTLSHGGKIGYWDFRTGSPAASPIHEKFQAGSVLSPDGNLVINTDGSEVEVWELKSGKTISVPIKGSQIDLLDGLSEAEFDEFYELTGYVSETVFSKDGTRILTVSAGDSVGRWIEISVWDVQTGSAIGFPIKHNGMAEVVKFSSDGARVLTVSFDNVIRIWDVESGTTIGSPIKPDQTIATAVFSPDGKRVLAGLSDGSVRIWSVFPDFSAFLNRVRSRIPYCLSPEEIERELGIKPRQAIRENPNYCKLDQ